MSEGKHWSARREGGGWFAIWLIRTVGLKLGRPAARAALYPITLYFYFRRPYERGISYAFLERALGRPARMREVLRHIHRFAGTILDRVFLLADRFARFDVRIHGLEELTSRMRPDRGVLLLGSHVGSFEVLRAAAIGRPDVKVRAVLDTQKTPALTELLHAINPDIARNVIDASRSGAEVVLALGEAIGEGALAALLADRARPQEATVMADFFGAPAPFPTAPFLIGSVLKAPIVLCFGMYRGGNRYDLYFEAFEDAPSLSRRHREAEAQAMVQRYAARLEHHVRGDPYNWFNWHDFWNSQSEDGAAAARRRPVAGPPLRGSAV